MNDKAIADVQIMEVKVAIPVPPDIFVDRVRFTLEWIILSSLEMAKDDAI